MGKTIVHGTFEWDEDKANENISKHGLRFEDILPIFDDPLFWEQTDFANSTLEETRFLGVGKLNNFAVIVSCYTERNGRTRIINARITTSEEERKYENWCKQFYS
jgi:uncharacterized DUF497 family protein